jgi:mannose-1-phosphate guanylyltransferase
MRYGMVMAGGSGTRLWPLSRRERPKQLLPLLLENRCLLEEAVDRLEGVVEPGNRLVCTAERFRRAILESISSLDDEHLLGEPTGRDTVNAVGLTAAILEGRDEEAVFAVLTADHLITPKDEFARALDLGFRIAEAEPTRFVTFSITPDFAATGYGWVERGAEVEGFEGAYEAASFVEKPERDRAEAFLASGRWNWNSGMFVFSAKGFMQALEKFLPANAEGLRRIAAAWDTPERKATLEEVYPTLTRISVDHGVMEPASASERFHVTTVPMAVKWLDVGSWPSLAKTIEPDAGGNRVIGRLFAVESRGVLSVSSDPDHLVCTLGCEDLVVVHTADATLVCPIELAEQVKFIAERVPAPLR